MPDGDVDKSTGAISKEGDIHPSGQTIGAPPGWHLNLPRRHYGEGLPQDGAKLLDKQGVTGCFKTPILAYSWVLSKRVKRRATGLPEAPNAADAARLSW